MKIVIFDTGTGGELFAEYFRNSHPDIVIEKVIDRDNAPYGDRTEDEIFDLTDRAVGKYSGSVDAIVLACNTATAAAIDRLRVKYPEQIFIGFEPMLKTAAKITKTGTVMVLATSATKTTNRYRRLKSRFPKIRVIEPNCDRWAAMIDNGVIGRKDIKNVLDGQLDSIDVIILACTHYVAISDQIQQITGPNITVINPFDAVASYIVKITKKTVDTA